MNSVMNHAPSAGLIAWTTVWPAVQYATIELQMPSYARKKDERCLREPFRESLGAPF